MTKENKFKIGLCLQGIALSMDDITLKANEDRLKMIEDIIAGEEQEPKWDRLYSWLNDMRYGIAPDETVTDIDERNVRTAQVDLLDEIMEWLEKNEIEPKAGHWIRIGYDIYECSICGQNVMTGDICAYKHCHGCGARMESEE